MRKLCTLTILMIFPATLWASPRQNGNVSTRGTENAAPGSLLSSVYSDLYSDIPTLVRALVAPRVAPVSGTRGSSPRIYGSDTSSENNSNQKSSVEQIKTKSDYINFLKDSNIGNKSDCADRYNKYIKFFGHDSTLSGQIAPKDGGISNGRLDTTCEFLGYAHWCFALGFAYAIRDFNDPIRINGGGSCMTYQEFCENGKTLDNFRIEEYLSRVIDEIMFYNTSIKNTNRNIVNTTVRTDEGITNGWKGYDTDSWVQERIPKSEMKRLLCD